jgi:uncharacterized membrane protein
MRALSVTRPPAAAAMAWMKTGFALFTPAAVPWMGMSAAFFLAAFAISLIPMVGPLALELLSPFLVAAYMAAAQAAERGEPTGLIHVGVGFQRGRHALLVIGVVYLVAHLVVGQVMTLIGGDAVERLVAQSVRPQEMDPEQMRALLDQAMPALLTGTLLFTPLLMATWFAPALVLFEAFPPGKAMFWSLWACLVNWRPMLLYGLLLSLLGVVALLIPLGLGLLLFLPLAMTSTYAAYRTQFVNKETT